jgi:hypothetical protein
MSLSFSDLLNTSLFPRPVVRVLDALTLKDLDVFFAFDQQFPGGVFVAGR